MEFYGKNIRFKMLRNRKNIESNSFFLMLKELNMVPRSIRISTPSHGNKTKIQKFIGI